MQFYQFPYLLVNIGSGVSILKVEAPDKVSIQLSIYPSIHPFSTHYCCFQVL